MRLLTTLLFVIFSVCSVRAQGLVEYVNTLQGTHSSFELSRGNTYPTLAMPWGMNFWTPQTGENRNGWIYRYSEDIIRGFRQTHQCSPWANDYAAFSLMPVSGDLRVTQHDRFGQFRHEDEIARPHYYKVTLEDKITAEMSPTERGVFMRYTFPKGKPSYVIVDGNNSGSMVKIFPEERKIIGYCKNASNHPGLKNFANYFVMTFDKPFKAQGTWSTDKGVISAGALEAEDDYVGAYVEFAAGAKVNVKVASSFISVEQAEQNLAAELGDAKNLEVIKDRAAAEWNKQLGKMVVETNVKKDKETFYTCYFRAMLFPRKFYEFNTAGEPIYYSPYDGKVYDGYMFTDNGFWDTFRAQFPLNIILHPEMHGRYLTSILDAYDQSGWLPSWSCPGHSGGMIGNHSFSLLADAHVKGLRTFDAKRAVDAMFHDANAKGPRGPSIGREAAQDFHALGYVPSDKFGQSTSKTLEYAYNDWCAFQIAKDTDKGDEQRFFSRHIMNYRNLYDPQTRFMRGKRSDGFWQQSVEEFDPYRWGGEFIEGNAWHYHWSVFQDIQGLINLMGGDEAFVAKMDSVFRVPNKVNVGSYGFMIHEMTEMVLLNMGQYAHGNQPIQHMIYLYNYAGEPWKAQYWARRVMRQLYNAGPEGYCGDEDQGQTSAWYVISSMGLYSVTPGTDQYVIGSPAFPKMTVSLENGNKISIIALNNSPTNVYIQSATLNGEPLNRTYLTYSELMNGADLVYTMGDKPNKSWGTDPAGRPFSISKPKQ